RRSRHADAVTEEGAPCAAVCDLIPDRFIFFSGGPLGGRKEIRMASNSAQPVEIPEQKREELTPASRPAKRPVEKPWTIKVDTVLLQNYALPRADAVEMEACLRDWFHAFVRRPGSPETLERLRPHLLAMTCNAGHVYWSARTDVPMDGNVRRSLSLGPERIAT